MTFKENIHRICREKGTSLTTVVRQVTNSSSLVTAINKGSLPKEVSKQYETQAKNN